MPDSNTLAVGAPYFGALDTAGQVQVWQWQGADWQPKGLSLNGPHPFSCFGASVSMPDANTLAVGAPYYSDSNLYTGLVRVFLWKNGSWIQKGSDLTGLNDWDRFGYQLDMPDSNTLAVSSPFASSGAWPGAGIVQVYRWNGFQWTLKGQPLTGQAAETYLGLSLNMPDSLTLAVGAPWADLGAPLSSSVSVYQWNGTNWQIKGAPLVTSQMLSFFGNSVSMPDAETLAIGEPAYGPFQEGRTWIYQWQGNQWVPKGAPLIGTANDYSGFSVAMADSETMVIGAPGNFVTLEIFSYTNPLPGRCYVYQWNGTGWTLQGIVPEGDAAGDNMGTRVSMPDPKTFATGLPFHDAGGPDAGQARVYSELAVTSQTSKHPASWLNVFPNPSDGMIIVNLQMETEAAELTLRNLMGQVVHQQLICAGSTHRLMLPQQPGLYLLEAVGGNGKVQHGTILRK